MSMNLPWWFIPWRHKPAPIPAPPPPPAGPVPFGIPGTWQLVFSDEFNGTSLDTSKWVPGWWPNSAGLSNGINDSSNWNGYSADHVSVGNGMLSLRLDNTPMVQPNGVAKQYTSGMVSSNPHDGRASGGFEFTYGVAEARIWLPGQPVSVTKIANWPAFWLDGQNWPADGEIDIMEGSGGFATQHIHTPTSNSGSQASGNYGGSWHVYSVNWQPGRVDFYIDGVQVWTMPDDRTSPNYLILNYAAWTGDQPVAPATMLVDYVRVFQNA